MGTPRRVATMTVYDSVERSVGDECEPLRGRRPRTVTLTRLLFACVAVCVCAIVATTAVNTHREGMAPSLGSGCGGSGCPKELKELKSWSPQCKSKQAALKKNLTSCNSDLKSKINERSAELGEPVRNGRVLLGAGRSTSCASVMKEEQDLLAECKAELAVHNENAELKAENEKLEAVRRNCGRRAEKELRELRDCLTSSRPKVETTIGSESSDLIRDCL